MNEGSVMNLKAICQVPADCMVACERVQGGRGTKF